MISSRTVFVLGAGLSIDFSLPLATKTDTDLVHPFKSGEGLKWDIIHRCHLLMRDTPIGVYEMDYEKQTRIAKRNGGIRQWDGGIENLFRTQTHKLLQKMAGDQTAPSIREVADELLSGLHYAPSIDSHLAKLDDRQFAQKLGKALIVDSIAEYEFNCFQRLEEHGSKPEFFGTGIAKLFSILSERVESSSVDQDLFPSTVRFVTFNYDRVLEWLFDRAMRETYPKIEGHRFDFLRKKLSTQTHHVFGRIGDLEESGIEQKVSFGANPHELRNNTSSWAETADSIRTYTESALDLRGAQTIRKEMSEAQRIVFLGFAFHPDTLTKILPSHLHPGVANSKKITGTTFGVPAAVVDQATDIIRSHMQDVEIDLSGNKPASQFLSENFNYLHQPR